MEFPADPVAVKAAKAARTRADEAAAEYARAVANSAIANQNVYFVGAPEYRNTDGKEMAQKLLEAASTVISRTAFDRDVIKPILNWVANVQKGSNKNDRFELLLLLRDTARDCMTKVNQLSITAALADDAAVVAEARAASA